MEQQQRIVGHSVKIDIGPSICRLAIDFLPITAVPEGEQVFVSGIEIITVASPEVDDLGDVDGTAEIETCPDVISVACEIGPLPRALKRVNGSSSLIAVARFTFFWGCTCRPQRIRFASSRRPERS